MPEKAENDGFAILISTFAKLISNECGFCKTYFCFQGAIPEVFVAKTFKPELTFANRKLSLLFTLLIKQGYGCYD